MRLQSGQQAKCLHCGRGLHSYDPPVPRVDASRESIAVVFPTVSVHCLLKTKAVTLLHVLHGHTAELNEHMPNIAVIGL